MHRAPEPWACPSHGYWNLKARLEDKLRPGRSTLRPTEIHTRQADDISGLCIQEIELMMFQGSFCPWKNLWINRQKSVKFWRAEFSSSVSLEYAMGFIESQVHQEIYWVTGTPLKTKSFLPVTLQQCFCTAQNRGVLTPQAAIRHKAMRGVPRWEEQGTEVVLPEKVPCQKSWLYSQLTGTQLKSQIDKGNFSQRSHCTSESEQKL